MRENDTTIVKPRNILAAALIATITNMWVISLYIQYRKQQNGYEDTDNSDGFRGVNTDSSGGIDIPEVGSSNSSSANRS